MKSLRLNVTDKDGATTTLVFRELPVRIGRDSFNECELRYGFVSRAHARIELRGGVLVVRDEGSRHGTFLGEDRLEPGRAVEIGEREIRIGTLRLRAELLDDAYARNSTRSYDASRIDPAAIDDAAVREQALEALVDLRAAMIRVREVLRTGFGPLDESRRRALAMEIETDLLAARALIALDHGRPTDADVALMKLRELSLWFAPHAPPLSSPEAVERFAERVKTTLLTFITSLENLRFAYACETGFQPGDADLGARLLDWTDPTTQPARALEATFVEIVTHHAELTSEVARGVAGIFDTLAPEAIEESVAADRWISFGPFHFKALWQAYVARHTQLRAAGDALVGKRYAQVCAALDGACARPRDSQIIRTRSTPNVTEAAP